MRKYLIALLTIVLFGTSNLVKADKWVNVHVTEDVECDGARGTITVIFYHQPSSLVRTMSYVGPGTYNFYASCTGTAGGGYLYGYAATPHGGLASNPDAYWYKCTAEKAIYYGPGNRDVSLHLDATRQGGAPID